MERDSDALGAIVELGVASQETQGLPGHHMEGSGLWTMAGISDD